MPVRRMEVDFGFWGTVRKVAITLVTIAVLCVLAAWYVPILRQTTALQKEIANRREALKKQRELYQRHTEELAALRTDPETVERETRKKLGWAKPNETIYRFESVPPDK